MTNEYEELVLDWQAVVWRETTPSGFLRRLEELESDMTDLYSAYERLMRVREAAGEVMSDDEALRTEYFKRLTERMTNDTGSDSEAR